MDYHAVFTDIHGYTDYLITMPIWLYIHLDWFLNSYCSMLTKPCFIKRWMLDQCRFWAIAPWFRLCIPGLAWDRILWRDELSSSSASFVVILSLLSSSHVAERVASELKVISFWHFMFRTYLKTTYRTAVEIVERQTDYCLFYVQIFYSKITPTWLLGWPSKRFRRKSISILLHMTNLVTDIPFYITDTSIILQNSHITVTNANFDVIQLCAIIHYYLEENQSDLHYRSQLAQFGASDLGKFTAMLCAHINSASFP